LITTVAEMVMSGNCGMRLRLESGDVIAQLFSEEAGLVIEYVHESEDRVFSLLAQNAVPVVDLGETVTDRRLVVTAGDAPVLDVATPELLSWWESTSDELEMRQMNPNLAAQQARLHDRQGPRYHLSFSPEATPPAILERARKPPVAIIREEGSNGDREMTSAFYTAGFEPWDVTMSDLLKGDITLDRFRGVVFVGGFSYADVLDSSKGWAGIIRFNERLKECFEAFYRRPDAFSLGVCNGCQLMALLGWIPWEGIPDTKQPRFIRNSSGRFESRWATVKILESPAIMLRGMEGSTFGIWVAHGEGRLYCPDPEILQEAGRKRLTPICFVDDEGDATERYPFNPNGSVLGITALCSPDGRHLAVMPHPERSFLKWQWPWMPESWRHSLKAAPWTRMFQNARFWCEEVGR
jgi:phosphoribosylformylglycinamidine synthase